MSNQNEMASGAAPAAAPDVSPDTPVTTVHTSYVTAQLVPNKRALRAVLKDGVDIAELSGDLFYYRWETSSTDQKTGSKKRSYIVGPSVKLANEAARIFGNCVVQQKPVQETKKAWIFTSAFIDLETGFTRERQFRMDKQFTVYGRMDRYRKDDIRFQIGQSKSDRNVTLNALPQILIDKMLKAALQSIKANILFTIKNTYGSNIQKAIDETLKAMAEHDIDQALIEEKLGLKRQLWDVDTLVILSGDYKALEAGEQTKATLYSLDETDDPNGGATQPESDKPGLSVGDMKPGDSANHQSVAGKTTETADKPAADTSEPDAPTDTAPPENVKEKQPDDAGAAPDKKAEPTREELVGKLLDLSEEKTPVISDRDQKRINEIGLKHSDWDLTRLGAAVREIEGMKIIKKPEKNSQAQIKL